MFRSPFAFFKLVCFGNKNSVRPSPSSGICSVHKAGETKVCISQRGLRNPLWIVSLAALCPHGLNSPNSLNSQQKTRTHKYSLSFGQIQFAFRLRIEKSLMYCFTAVFRQIVIWQISLISGKSSVCASWFELFLHVFSVWPEQSAAVAFLLLVW